MKTFSFLKICALCFILSSLFASFTLSQTVTADIQLDYVANVGDNASMNWTTKVIRVKGQGVGTIKIKDLGRRKLTALRAAELDAYRRLLEVVQGVQVTSYASVGDMMKASPTITTRITGILKGMQLIDVTYSDDGGCTVTMEVNIDRDGQFLLTALNSNEIKITDNYPKFDWEKVLNELEKKEAALAYAQSERYNAQNKGNSVENNEPGKRDDQKVNTSLPPQPTPKKEYTGLLVDARNKELKPVLAPTILNPKQEKLYGIGTVPAKITGGAIVSYLHGDIERAKKQKEIGDNPLVVICIQTVAQSNIMVSEDDADKMLFIIKLLEQKKVAILI